MNKAIIILIIMSFICGGFITYFAFFRETKTIENNLYIKAVYNNEDIEIGYDINGLTGNLTKGYNIIKLSSDKAVINTINLENQTFYKYSDVINLSSENKYIIQLTKPETVKYEIKEDGINLSSKNFKDIVFCIKHSNSYIFVESNFTKIDKIYNDYSKCYDTDSSLLDSSLFIPIKYTIITSPREKDFINIIVTTKEYLNNTLEIEFR